jgi:histidinol-phosphate aminotransferase
VNVNASGSATLENTAYAAPLDLSDNTSRFGTPPAARRTLAAVSPARVTRYPSEQGDSLREAVAEQFGVRPAEVVTGTGSDALLDLAFRTFAAPGDRIAYTDPVFAMVPHFARRQRLVSCQAPRTCDGGLDVAALLGAEPRVLYVCSPDNPTGAAAPDDQLRELVERAPGVVVLDHAYAEFADEQGARAWAVAATRSANLIVTRTLSKAWGLAGLRLGIAIASTPLAEAMRDVRGPYALAGPSEDAAAAALRGDVAWMRRRVALARRNRERLREALESLGFRPLPSCANFVLVPVPDAEALASALLTRGIRVRAFRALRGIGDAVRITVAPWRELQVLLATLAEVGRCA